MRMKEFLQPGGTTNISQKWDNMPLAKKIEYIQGFLEQRSYTPEQRAAIIGNLIQENATLSPKVANPSSKAIGIAQWLGPRKKQLFARKDPYNIVTQLEHLDSELKGNEHWTNNIGGKKAFFSNKNVEQLTQVIRKDFERPGESEANDKARIDNAYSVLRKDYNSIGSGSNGYNQYYSSRPHADMSQYKSVFEDMQKGLFDYKGIQQAYEAAPEFTEMMMTSLNQSRDFAETQRLEQERQNQENQKKMVEQENLEIQQALDLQQHQRDQMLAMVPQLRSVTSGPISPQI